MLILTYVKGGKSTKLNWNFLSNPKIIYNLEKNKNNQGVTEFKIERLISLECK